jgi:hypothetical protein
VHPLALANISGVARALARDTLPVGGETIWYCAPRL